MGYATQSWTYLKGWSGEALDTLAGPKFRIAYVVLAYALMFWLFLGPALAGVSLDPLAFAGLLVAAYFASRSLIDVGFKAGYEVRHGMSFDDEQRERWMQLGAIQERTRQTLAAIEKQQAEREYLRRRQQS